MKVSFTFLMLESTETATTIPCVPDFKYSKFHPFDFPNELKFDERNMRNTTRYVDQ